MRTNIEIDDDLMERAMHALGLNTKRAVVETALRAVVERQAVRERQREAIKAMRGLDPDWNDGRFDEGEDAATW